MENYLKRYFGNLNLTRLIETSLLLRRFVFRVAEASAKQVTGDEPQGSMGRVQTAGEAPA